MNALNVNRHRLALGFVHQFLAAVRMQVTGHDISDYDFTRVEKLDNCEVAASGANFDSEEALAWINKHYGSIHVDTSNAIGQGSAACGASPAPTGCAANGTNNERTEK